MKTFLLIAALAMSLPGIADARSNGGHYSGNRGYEADTVVMEVDTEEGIPADVPTTGATVEDTTGATAVDITGATARITVAPTTRATVRFTVADSTGATAIRATAMAMATASPD